VLDSPFMRWLLPLALLACGGGGGAPDAALPDAGEVMPPLHADPAVALGCAPGALAAGQTRAKPIACAAELLTGRLAAGRVGDLLLENARVRLVVRGPGEGFAMYGMSGGGIVMIKQSLASPASNVKVCDFSLRMHP